MQMAPAPAASRKRFAFFGMGGGQPAKSSPPPPPNVDDSLLELASKLDSDGGMPGKSIEDRAVASVVALLAFAANEHSHSRGVFRGHVIRLLRFLESLSGLAPHQQQVIARVLDGVRQGGIPATDWLGLAQSGGCSWAILAGILLAGQ
jgi:hypothetical protein